MRTFHHPSALLRAVASASLLVGLGALTSSAAAHFPFIIPDASGATATLVLSETLAPDRAVNVGMLSSASLSLRDADAHVFALATPRAEMSEPSMSIALPGAGVRVVSGVIDLGVMSRGAGPAHRLVYHPKTVVGDPFAATFDALVTGAPVELVPVKDAGGVRLRFLSERAPLAAASVTLLLSDGSEREVATDAEGLTPPLASGRVGAWARHWVEAPGEIDGKAYVQLRRYATLVVDMPGAPAAAAASVDAPPSDAVAVATLPRPIASFGATVHDGWLYVYGGHFGERHDYSTATVSGRFSRAKLDDLTRGHAAWQELPGGPAAQGLNLVSYRDVVIRVGGMEPRNAAGEPADNHSLAEVASYSVRDGGWESLAPLPEPRSSHDVVVIGDTMYVVGGWTMAGKGSEIRWPDHGLSLDLASPNATWRTFEQPFRRRALIAATLGAEIVVIGGFDEEDRPHTDVVAFDTTTRQWSTLPSIPGPARNGFAPAACVSDGRLFVSVADGQLLRLAADRGSWEAVTTTTPRIVHRMVAADNELLLVGGAREATMTNLIEAVALDGTPRERSVLATVAARWRHPQHERVAASMGLVDDAFDALRDAESAGWIERDADTGLDAAEEAEQLRNHLLEVPVEGSDAPEAFRTTLATNIDRVDTMRALLAAAPRDASALTAQLALIRASCRECHRAFRD